MSKREAELFIFDIYIAILKIEYIASKFNDPQTMKYDFVHWDSVIREFEIIGIAMKKLIQLNHFTKEKQTIVDFRNVLAHEYFGIDEEEVWFIINYHLPSLKKTIQNKIYSIPCDKRNQLIKELLEENTPLKFITTKLKELACLQD